ncbi:uncharacterized protein LOC129616523 [Condylostylus longicornis]|uniref:uncharacterized protein LOC129616523 n=1 Tax=Condylostylus longicornis TaxID=2530218 RepID=UPI00244E1EC1|nr:uncharacterized protein LOC129616523 [Condylostylus longicornis]
MKKYSNLLATSHKIKKRNKKTGQSATLWIFYDMFNEVYGISYTIEPPPNTLIQTLNSGEDDVNDEESESISTPKRPKRNDVYELIKAENKITEQRHQDLLEIEKTNIELERAKFQTLLDLKDILKKCLTEK